MIIDFRISQIVAEDLFAVGRLWFFEQRCVPAPWIWIRHRPAPRGFHPAMFSSDMDMS